MQKVSDMNKEKLYLNMMAAHFPKTSRKEEIYAFIDEMIIRLWEEGYDLNDIKAQASRLLHDIYHSYERQNTMDILAGRYQNKEEMKQKMPLYIQHDDQGNSMITNVPQDYMNWAMVMSRFNHHICIS